MGKGRFSPEEKKLLLSNPNVTKVTDQTVSYTDEFREYFLKQYDAGIKPSQIFLQAGFEPSVLGCKRIERTSARWRKERENGSEERRRKRIADKEYLDNAKQTYEDLIKAQTNIERLNHKIAVLQAEVDLLKKAGNLGRGRCKRKVYGKPDLVRLIDETMREHSLENAVMALCDVVGMTKADYYYRKHQSISSDG